MLESLFPQPTHESASDPALRDNEQVVINGQTISFRIQRSARRRTLTLLADKNGFRAQAPLYMPHHKIIAFFHEKADWVQARLAENEVQERMKQAPLQLWVMGQPFAMRALPNDAPQSTGLDVLARTFWYSAHESPAESARVALQNLAEREIAKRLPAWAARMGLPLPRWAMSRAETRWGSCSRQTGLRFSWKLGAVFPMLIDYVVVHELAHLRHMNHSDKFWREVEKYYPSWAIARRELRAFEQKLARW